jgi:hypothetical protein
MSRWGLNVREKMIDLYFCAICGAVALGLLFALTVDAYIENRGHINWPWRRKRGKHEIQRSRRDWRKIRR